MVTSGSRAGQLQHSDVRVAQHQVSNGQVDLYGVAVGVGETSFLKKRRVMDQEMGNETEFETRNGKQDGIRDEKWA